MKQIKIFAIVIIIGVLIIYSCGIGDSVCDPVPRKELVKTSRPDSVIVVPLYIKSVSRPLTQSKVDQIARYANEHHFWAWGIEIQAYLDDSDFTYIRSLTIYEDSEWTARAGTRGWIAGWQMHIKWSTLYSSTLSHELGHSMWMKHQTYDTYNVMYAIWEDCTEKPYFDEWQIEEALPKIDGANDLRKIESIYCEQ